MNARPLPFTVYPKKTRMLLYFLLCVGFVAGGVWMIRDGEKMGWLCAGFFGLGIPVFLIQLLPKSSFLSVDEEGIEFCALFRTHKLKWSEISEFGICFVPGTRMVGFNYSADYPRARKARALSKALTGCEGALPDTYGFGVDELTQLLSAYHEERLERMNKQF
jgi:hypothetical protein